MRNYKSSKEIGVGGQDKSKQQSCVDPHKEVGGRCQEKNTLEKKMQEPIQEINCQIIS